MISFDLHLVESFVCSNVVQFLVIQMKQGDHSSKWISIFCYLHIYVYSGVGDVKIANL
jgi:hypothetical protein